MATVWVVEGFSSVCGFVIGTASTMSKIAHAQYGKFGLSDSAVHSVHRGGRHVGILIRFPSFWCFTVMNAGIASCSSRWLFGFLGVLALCVRRPISIRTGKIDYLEG